MLYCLAWPTVNFCLVPLGILHSSVPRTPAAACHYTSHCIHLSRSQWDTNFSITTYPFYVLKKLRLRGKEIIEVYTFGNRTRTQRECCFHSITRRRICSILCSKVWNSIRYSSTEPYHVYLGQHKEQEILVRINTVMLSAISSQIRRLKRMEENFKAIELPPNRIMCNNTISKDTFAGYASILDEQIPIQPWNDLQHSKKSITLRRWFPFSLNTEHNFH